MMKLANGAALALTIVTLGGFAGAAGAEPDHHSHSGRNAPGRGGGYDGHRGYGPAHSGGDDRGRGFYSPRFNGPGYRGYGYYGPSFYSPRYYGPGYYGPGYYGSGYYGPGYYRPGYWDDWLGVWSLAPYAAPEYDYPPPPAPYYGAPPPPPAMEQPQSAAPEAPAAEHAFVVYFPLDSADLNPADRKVIAAAAKYSAENPGAAVKIVGHTDTSGSDAHNTALSERRSKAVRAALTAAGVSDSAVEMDWKGKREPAIKTPDGVREPSNRRVTILVGGPPDRDNGGDGDGNDDRGDGREQQPY